MRLEGTEESKDLRSRIITEVDKEFGDGTSLVLDDDSGCGVDEWVSTGSLIINAAIGRPGLPVGRLIAITGKPASGKSTLACHIIKATQAAGGLAVLMDTEHTYDPQRAALIGVKNDDMLFFQDLFLESAFGIVTRMADINIKSGCKRQITVIVDSHSSTPTRAEVEMDDDASKSEIATSARVTSLHLKRLIGPGILTQGRVTLVFICQIKSAPMKWGAGESYLAENPIFFHSSLILRMAGKGKLPKKDGIKVGVRVRKSKVGPPFRECEVDVLEEGIDETRVLLEQAVESKLVAVKGSGYYVLGDQTFRKKEWRKMLTDTPSLRRELHGLITGELK